MYDNDVKNLTHDTFTEGDCHKVEYGLQHIGKSDVEMTVVANLPSKENHGVLQRPRGWSTCDVVSMISKFLNVLELLGQ